MWGSAKVFSQRKVLYVKQFMQNPCLSKTECLSLSPNLISTNKDFIVDGINLKILRDSIKHPKQVKSTIDNIHIEDYLKKYLTEQYCHSNEQNLATLLLCNLHYVGRDEPPTQQCTKLAINVLNSGSILAIIHCLGLICNAAKDHPQWIQKIDSENHLCEILFKLLKGEEFGNFNHSYHYSSYILKAITLAAKSSRPHNKFIICFPILLRTMTNLPQQTQIYYFDHQIVVTQAMVCFYQLAVILPQDSLAFILNIEDIKIKWDFLVEWFKDKTSCVILTILIVQAIMDKCMPALHLQIINRYITFLGDLVSSYDYLVKDLAYLIVIKAIEEKTISVTQICSHEGFLKMLELQDEDQLLYFLVQIYQVAVESADQCLFAKRLKKGLQRINEDCYYLQQLGQKIHIILSLLKGKFLKKKKP